MKIYKKYMSVDAVRKVWEVLSDVANITEQQARTICMDFTMVGFALPPDDPAGDHLEMVQGLCENMEQSDIREAMLHGDTDSIYVEHGSDEGDPFYYNAKLALDDISMYLVHHKVTDEQPTFHCVICGEQAVSTGGVKLSCSLNSKPCTSVFCKDCVVPWLTQCLARCPSCRSFCKKIHGLPVHVERKSSPPPIVQVQAPPPPVLDPPPSVPSAKKRILISIRKTA